MTLTDDSHTLNPALPRPPTRIGPGSTSRLPMSQAPTDKPDSLNPGSLSLPGQGLTDTVTLTSDSHALDLPSPGAPTDKPDPLNPGPSLPHGNSDFNFSLYQDHRQITLIDDSHALNQASPFDSRPLNPGPSHDFDSHYSPQFTAGGSKDGSTSSPIQHSSDESNPSSPDHPLSPGPPHGGLDVDSDPGSPRPIKYGSLAEIMSTSTDVHDSSPSQSSSSWNSEPLQEDSPSHSGPSERPPQPHVSRPARLRGSSQGRVPSRPYQEDKLPPDTQSFSSGETSEDSSALGQSSTEESNPSSLGQSSTDESNPSSPGQSSTDESHPPTSPSSQSNPGSPMEPNPPPSMTRKRPRPDDPESGSSLSKIGKIFKGKLKRHFSGSGALNAARGPAG